MTSLSDNIKIDSYLTFKLGEESFAANVSKVLNILEMVKITKVPKAPVYMKGVINLRGSVLPLIDTRIKFSMGETPITNNTCILVLEIDMDGENIQVGAMVDAVQEVLEIKDKEILPAPKIGTTYKNEFIEGMAKNGEEFIMILNMDLIFSTEELIELKETSKTKNTEKIENESVEK